jgi:hypothetical protein
VQKRGDLEGMADERRAVTAKLAGVRALGKSGGRQRQW